MGKPIYKLVDGKGRILIPKDLRDAAGMGYGDIVRLGLSDGRVTVRKVDVPGGGGGVCPSRLKIHAGQHPSGAFGGTEQPPAEKGGVTDAALYQGRL